MRLGLSVDAYTDAIGAVAEHLAGPGTTVRIDEVADVPAHRTDRPTGVAGVRGHLATLAVEGHDPVAALGAAIAGR